MYPVYAGTVLERQKKLHVPYCRFVTICSVLSISQSINGSAHDGVPVSLSVGTVGVVHIIHVLYIIDSNNMFI